MECLELAGTRYINPGFRNTSVRVHADRVSAGVKNRRFLKALYATYPELQPARPDFSHIPDREEKKFDYGLHLAQYSQLTNIERARQFKQGLPLGRGIIAAVAGWFGYSPDDLTGKSRKEHIVTARFVAAKLLRDQEWQHSGYVRFSYPEIGTLLGGRDHSTIIHACETFFDRARKFPAMLEAYEALKDG